MKKENLYVENKFEDGERLRMMIIGFKARLQGWNLTLATQKQETLRKLQASISPLL